MQSCPKPCAIAFITTVAVAFLLIFEYRPGLPGRGGRSITQGSFRC